MDIQILLQNLLDWFLNSGIRILIIIIGVVILKKIAKIVISDAIRKLISHEDSEAEERRENTLIGILSGIINILILFTALMMILAEFNINIGPVLAGAGILGVALGFGAQWMVRDFLAGLFIILENQYRIGDWIVVGKVSGEVESVTLRKTVLRDRDGAEHHIPNGEIKQAANLSKDFGNLNLYVNIAYNENLDKVIDVLNKVGNELAKDAEWKDKVLEAPQVLGVDDFADSSIVLRIWGKTAPLIQWSMARELRKRIKVAFDKEGIEIPFPQMTVSMRGENKK